VRVPITTLFMFVSSKGRNNQPVPNVSEYIATRPRQS
jgi:hypothetical protein